MAQNGLVERCTAQNWSGPLTDHDGAPARRPVVALGKFDALHRGHRALAAAAARLGGSPLLLSFSGMAEVLGWPKRLPLVPPCDRSRVLARWAQDLGLTDGRLTEIYHQHHHQQQQVGGGKGGGGGAGGAPGRVVRQRYIPFVGIRHLSPEEFVRVLAEDMKAAGVVAGVNYRFGE
jgi:hypothetical protein